MLITTNKSAFIKIAIFIVVSLCFVACNKSVLEDQQRETILKDLEGKKLSFEESDGVFYVRYSNPLSDTIWNEEQVPTLKPRYLLKNGDPVCFWYVMQGYPNGVVFKTNSRQLAQDLNLGSDIGDDQVLCTNIGTKGILSGIDKALEFAAVGDSADIILTSKWGYGDVALGNVPPNTPLKILVIIPE